MLWMGVLCVVTWCAKRTTSIDTTRHIHNILSTAPQLCISHKALGMLPEDGNVMPKHVRAHAHHVTKHNTPIHNVLSTAPQLSISQKALGTLPEDGNIMRKHV